MKRILVVEDEKTIRDLIGEILTMLGYEVVICESAKEALSFIASADLIISDFRMPGMNGDELAKIAKQEKSDLPFIIITGTPWDIKKDALAIDRVVEKPFSIERIQIAIKEFL